MNRPYIICHMMTSVDGRIDCAMTEHLPGVQEYYDTLDALNAPTRISGRVTAQLEMSKPGVFACDDPHPLEREGFFKAESAPGYEVVPDTRGTLLWDKPAAGERPLLILTSCQASREYLAYLEEAREMDLEIASEFLLIAATLLNIKAKMLLPKRRMAEGEEAVEEDAVPAEAEEAWEEAAFSAEG